MRTAFLAAASVGAMILLSQGSAAKAAEIKVIAAAPMTAVFKELGRNSNAIPGTKSSPNSHRLRW